MVLLSMRNVRRLVAGMLLGVGSTAMGALSASATISSTPDGANFDYTIQLTNTGSTNIGTFWFGWTPPGQPTEYDFLPSSPNVTNYPDGWFGYAPSGFPGYSVEYYNYFGNPIAPGQTGTFEFVSSDSPSVLKNTMFGFANTTSFIYEGFPETGATAQVNPQFAAVPEPSSLALVAIGIVSGLGCRRRKAR